MTPSSLSSARYKEKYFTFQTRITRTYIEHAVFVKDTYVRFMCLLFMKEWFQQQNLNSHDLYNFKVWDNYIYNFFPKTIHPYRPPSPSSRLLLWMELEINFDKKSILQTISSGLTKEDLFIKCNKVYQKIYCTDIEVKEVCKNLTVSISWKVWVVSKPNDPV